MMITALVRRKHLFLRLSCRRTLVDRWTSLVGNSCLYAKNPGERRPTPAELPRREGGRRLLQLTLGARRGKRQAPLPAPRESHRRGVLFPLWAPRRGLRARARCGIRTFLFPIPHRETQGKSGAVPDTPLVPGVEAVMVLPRIVIRADVRVPIKIRGRSGPRTTVRRPLLRPEAVAAAREEGQERATERPRRWPYRTRHSYHSLKNVRPSHRMAM